MNEFESGIDEKDPSNIIILTYYYFFLKKREIVFVGFLIIFVFFFFPVHFKLTSICQPENLQSFFFVFWFEGKINEVFMEIWKI